MAYIGNARSLLIVGSNTRDDLVSTTENQVTFELSQEVPGGYESNITVLRQKYIIDNLISNNTSISVDQVEVARRTTPSSERLLQSSDAAVRAALSTIKVGDVVKFSIPSQPTNSLNDVVGFPVAEVVYTGDNIKIYLQTTVTGTVNTTANADEVSITLGSLDNWEVLEPELQYTISSSGGKPNRYITLTEAPKVNDKVYVLHKGEATYNFVPTVKSVGPNQLTENLRNFRTDRYTADGDTTLEGRTFAITATEDPEFTVVDAKSLLVTVDGEIFDSDGKDSAGQNFQGKWKLNDDRDAQNRQTITFHEAPTSGKQIRILNLGFSTVSRRASFALGQATTPGQGSVGEDELKNDSVSEGKIRDGAVTTPKIKNNAVNGTKILLENNELLRSKTNTTLRPVPTEFGLLKLGSTNITEIFGDPELAIHIAGTKKVSVNTTEIYPEITDDLSLGTLTKRFKNLSLSGTATVQGNIDVSGTVDGVDVSALRDTVINLKNYINSGALSPIGSIMAWSSSVVPTGWLRCNGSAINTHTYRDLHAIISNIFGGSAYVAGVTDQPGATTTFNLPDLVTRFPAGANQNATNIGAVETPSVPQATRDLTHAHAGAAHTHDLKDHTHPVPGHYHQVDNTSATTSPKALNILDSGKHTTRVDHDHKNNLTSEGTSGNVLLDKITWVDTTGNHTHSGTTSTCVATNSGNAVTLDHGHRSWATNSVGPWYDPDRLYGSELNLDHGHNFYGDISSTKQGAVSRLRVIGTDSGSVVKHDIDGSFGYDEVSSTPESSRAVNFYLSVQSTQLRATPSISAFNVAGSGSLDHRHNFSILSSGAHGHAGGFTIDYKGLDGHKAGSTDLADKRGEHSHSATAFDGAIGLRTGSNGNAAFNTGVPSDNSTGSANYGSNLSGPGVSPHLVVNFIIKVFNPTVS
jgi:microcystin-dependent protein